MRELNHDLYVLAYDVCTRKIDDILYELVKNCASQRNRIIVSISPMKYLKKHTPLIEHRPPNKQTRTTAEVAKGFGFNITSKAPPPGAVCLIAGAGLLDADFVKTRTVINAHPGYLPNVRGLDAFKWAIWQGEPLGVTTHICGPEPDSGLLIRREFVPIYRYDTMQTLAMRQFNLEILMLLHAIFEYKEAWQPLETHAPVNRRMPRHIEERLPDRFRELMDKWIRNGVAV